MEEMFDQDQICEPAEAQLVYNELSAAFRADLYVTDLTQPLPQLMINTYPTVATAVSPEAPNRYGGTGLGAGSPWLAAVPPATSSSP